MLLLWLAGTNIEAGEWHVEGSLVCQNCHLEHSTEGGTPLPGGPFSQLLLKNSVNELCLSCHDGSDPTAPDVLQPVQMYQGTATQESSAGYFQSLSGQSVYGHELGVEQPVPLQSQSTAMTLNCASCHAVHGNGNYRNLSYDPAGVGDSIILVEGADLFTQDDPAVPPTTAGSIAAYERGNIAYRRNFGAWCSSCHDKLATNSAGVADAHFNAHPSDIALDAYALDSHTDPVHWTLGTGQGFLGSDPAAGGITRVPFEAPQAIDFASAQVVDGSNEVFCGSCHKAHGSDKEKSLLWPYREGGLNLIAGCQQCHNK